MIHGMHDEQDLRQMGGLRRAMPITAVTMGIGVLALAGFPFMAGFFAKDLVLAIAATQGRMGYYALGSIGAVLSALYIGRLWFLTFGGRGRSGSAEGAHESSPILWVPLTILAAGALLAGLISSSPEGKLESFLRPVAGLATEGTLGLPKAWLSAIAVAIAIAGLAVAGWVYGSGRVNWLALRERLEPLPRTLLNGWYVDRAYDTVIVQPAKAGAWITAYVVDARIVDGAVNAVGGGVKRLAQGGRLVQTGFVRTYALVLFVGTVAILAYVGARL